jgi:hypothetical protein
MKYFIILLPFIFLGCNNSKPKEDKLYIKDIVEVNSTNTTKIQNSMKIENLVFYINDDNITYDFNSSKILLFVDDSQYSSLQIKALKKLNVKYYVIQNAKLLNYFKIQEYPTIIITKDNNNTKKYEGFIPSEILKYELKD